MSYGIPESLFTLNTNSAYQSPADFDSRLMYTDVTLVASSGDEGAFGLYNPDASSHDITDKVAEWPAVSPDVLSVGGTTLPLSPNNPMGDYPGTGSGGETGWSLPPAGEFPPPGNHYGGSGGGMSPVGTSGDGAARSRSCEH